MSDLTENLSKYGIDYAEAMDRVDGCEELYEKLAFKYLEDTHYVDLVAAMDVKDFDEAYKAAHALKGIAGNLSFKDLYIISAEISDALFQGEYQAAEKMMPRLGPAHEKVLEGLEKWRDGQF